MGFVEMFALGLTVIALATVLGLAWRVVNQIFRSIEHFHDDDKLLDEPETRETKDEARERRTGFSPPFWDFLVYLGFLATFSAVVYALRGNNASPRGGRAERGCLLVLALSCLSRGRHANAAKMSRNGTAERRVGASRLRGGRVLRRIAATPRLRRGPSVETRRRRRHVDSRRGTLERKVDG